MLLLVGENHAPERSVSNIARYQGRQQTCQPGHADENVRCLAHVPRPYRERQARCIGTDLLEVDIAKASVHKHIDAHHLCQQQHHTPHRCEKQHPRIQHLNPRDTDRPRTFLLTTLARLPRPALHTVIIPLLRRHVPSTTNRRRRCRTKPHNQQQSRQPQRQAHKNNPGNHQIRRQHTLLTPPRILRIQPLTRAETRRARPLDPVTGQVRARDVEVFGRNAPLSAVVEGCGEVVECGHGAVGVVQVLPGPLRGVDCGEGEGERDD